MKKGLVIALTLVLFLALVPGVFAQQKITVWCWDPNFNVYAMKQAAIVYNKTHPDVQFDIVDMGAGHRGEDQRRSAGGRRWLA